MDFKSYFQQPYQGGESFIENVIIPIFGESKFDDGYEEDIIEGHPELETVARATGITQILRLGTINIPMNPTDVFDITVSDRVQMERNRVAIQQLVRRIMSTYSSAFMIFHYDDDDKWDWRFSYSSKQSSNKDTTESKRYTFLLGPNQSCRTAAENFDKLAAKGGRIERADIIAAFDVEALSKEFFGKYKAQYEKFCQFVYEHKTEREWFGPEFEAWEDKRVRDYVKRLLGRIVFLHFLQKKGWMGVPADKAWGEGRQQFMKDLFDHASPAQQANYLDEVLEPLFGDALDTDRTASGDLFDTHVLGIGVVKVPYLNGGLFEKDEMDEPKSVFPAEYFRDLFTFFYQYNFTIDENDPDDAQVGVDPEMLGRIFENLLEDNKDKGAFYTPKEIVQYMCRESLIAYLQTDLTDEATREALRLFVTSYDAAVLGGASSALAAQVSEQLKAVKICDPAIGSGAFPMGLLRELFLCRSAIEGFERKQAADIKLHIIQQNIYGVDIEKGAVDIARLRFWLTLILDEETPHALPNLDFKIMQGNSLLEQYQGIDLTLVAKTKNERRKHILGNMQLTWFEADIDVTRNQLKEMMKEYYGCKDHARRSTLRDAMAANVKSQIQSLNGALDLSKINVAANSDFFLWHTWFADVFEEGGFDIVIGNPPYVVMPSGNYCINYQTYSSFDLYAYFYEQGINLIKEGASLCYITPNLFIKTMKFDSLRSFLEKYTVLKELKMVGDNVFDAVIPTCIVRLSKNKSNWKFSDLQSGGSILSKMERNGKTLNEISKIQRGFEVGRNKVLSSGKIRFLTGSTVSKYTYKSIVYISPQTYEEYSKDEFFFEGERLLIRETGSTLMALYLDEKIYSNRSLYSVKITNNKFMPKYILGCLNSRVIQYYYSQKFKSETELFPKIRIAQARLLPIPNATIVKQQPIITFVDEILSAKKANPQADTSALESEIDRLVYDLYGLTEEEIAIVEGK